MTYRIIKETERSGKNWYYVQKNFLFYFWRYLSEVRDMSITLYKIKINTKEEAEEYIRILIRSDIEKRGKKIISREVINTIE